jgi:ABC-type nitrate/sulfonate/bicarbonate transport system substrate-binding protein
MCRTLLPVFLLGWLLTQAGPTMTLRVGVVNQTATNWALYVGAARGYFAAEHLDLQLSVSGASDALSRQLRAGTVEVGHMAAGNVIEAVDAGADVAIVMAVNRPVFTLVGRPGIHELRALRGAAIGVDNGRTGYVHLVRALLRQAGVGDDDYTIKDVGGVDARDKALRSGDVQAALLSVPRDLQALSDGYVRLADVDQAPAVDTGSVAVASRAWIDGHRRELIAYIRAYRASLDWLYEPTHEAEAVGILVSRLAVDPALARQIYRETIIRKEWLLRDGQVKPSGLAAVAAQMGAAGPFDVRKYVDGRAYEAATGSSR